jgi:hypothetical protein
MRAYRLRRDGPPRRRLPTPARAHQARPNVQGAGQTADIATATVRPISLIDARAIVERYEWLGSMPALGRWAFGIFFGERCGGVAVFGDEYAENLAVWDRYGFTGKIVALLRGACLPWAHRHSASKLIRGAMALLPERYRIVTATCCAGAGEIGSVYQAAGFDFVGQMYGGTRALIHYQGRVISERHAKRRFGTCGRRELAALGIRAHLVPRRTRYFGFRGDCREQQTLRAAIADRIKPYPKRGHQAESQDGATASDRGRDRHSRRGQRDGRDRDRSGVRGERA